MASKNKKTVFVGMSRRRQGSGRQAGGNLKRKKPLVFVGMSGGVDSSVAALLLQKKGYDVVGVFLRCYNIDGCAEKDAEDARRVAGRLGIPFYVWDLEEEYKRRVVDYMIDGYRNGLTPNPDIECNREIKFGLFFERARKLGADFVATGHYVQLKNGKLYAAKDKNKDQSYFLWTLTSEQLKHCLFPIGDLVKPEVRRIAKKAGLPTAEKKDSQGICFLGKVKIEEFLKDYIPERKGDIVTTEGLPIGEHRGAHFYTIGQRHGLDLKTKLSALGVRGEHSARPHYVVSKDVKKNLLVVAEGEDNPALYEKDIHLRDVQFIVPVYSNVLKNIGIEVMARVRYRQPLSAAVLSGSEKNGFTLSFAKPQKFVAAGQSAVFYVQENPSLISGRRSGELRMLGGGIIV